MEFQTSIDAAVVGDALIARLEEDAVAHRRGGFTVTECVEESAAVTVHTAMHPQHNLVADVTWGVSEGGSRVSVAYRTPKEGEVEPVGFFAPVFAYLTMMVIIGGLMWALGFGLLQLMLGDHRHLAWMFAFIAPVVYFTYILIGSLTARVRARRRFERLMRDIFAE